MKKLKAQADAKKAMHPWRKTQSSKSAQPVAKKLDTSPASFEDSLNEKLRSIELENACLSINGFFLRTISFGGQADPVIILCLQVGRSGQSYQTLKWFDPVIELLREQIEALLPPGCKSEHQNQQRREVNFFVWQLTKPGSGQYDRPWDEKRKTFLRKEIPRRPDNARLLPKNWKKIREKVEATFGKKYASKITGVKSVERMIEYAERRHIKIFGKYAYGNAPANPSMIPILVDREIEKEMIELKHGGKTVLKGLVIHDAKAEWDIKARWGMPLKRQTKTDK